MMARVFRQARLRWDLLSAAAIIVVLAGFRLTAYGDVRYSVGNGETMSYIESSRAPAFSWQSFAGKRLFTTNLIYKLANDPERCPLTAISNPADEAQAVGQGVGHDRVRDRVVAERGGLDPLLPGPGGPEVVVEHVVSTDADGTYAPNAATLGTTGTGEGEFWMPSGIAIDRLDYIFVADTYNRRVQVFRYLPGESAPLRH